MSEQQNNEKQENIQNEQKTEVSEGKAPNNTAVKGFGGIVVIAAVLLVLFILNPFKDKSEENATSTMANKQEDMYAEEKVFSPTPAAINEFQPVQDNATYEDSFEAQQSITPILVKGLSGGALKTTSIATTGATTQQAGRGGSSAQPSRADELRAQALKLQEQLDALQMGGGSASSVPLSEESAAVANTAFVVTAKKSPLDANLAIEKGTFLPCVLKTKIVSTVAGNIACIISDDVYSAAGTVLLIEKGSVVQGYFRSGALSPGITRLFIIWEEIKTPKGIVVNVNAPATDMLGGSGIDGWVDNHYFKRFGAAVLLSVIDDALAAAVDNKDGRDYTMNTRENTMDIANTALENTINIPPTLYKNQGDIVGIFVNKDVDFRQVYRLARTNNRIPK